MLIDPPDSKPSPKWVQTLVHAANARNRARGSQEIYTTADLISAWKACGGCCAFSALPFGFQIVGNGQAKRPFAPSLDRIDRHKPYQRDNVRLVTAVANFAMNAWGDEPVLQLASALHRKQGDRPPSAAPAPPDADLDDVAPVDSDAVETVDGIVGYPARPDVRAAILLQLQQGPRSSRDLEEAVAERFGLSAQMRTALLTNGCPAWRNHVAWALVDLGRNGRGTGQIDRLETRRAPGGGSMGVYRLMPAAA
jgi:hypothetical protein